MKNIILINGKKRSGKDFFTEIFLSNVKNGVRIAFADKVKEILATTFGISVQEFDNLKNTDPKYRKIIQRFGTDAMQTIFGKDVWVKFVVDFINSSNYDYYLIPDFRFEHEFINIDGCKTTTIKILGGDGDTHISENGLNDFNFDYVLDNTKKDVSFKDEILKVIQILLH